MIKNEHREHLQSFVNHRNEITQRMKVLEAELTKLKEQGLKYTGAIDYLQQIGITLEPVEEVVEEGEEG
tara:strand:- start:332 stop:538 length:207 start_codon:yes stop_codon:yes gene_type:complete